MITQDDQQMPHEHVRLFCSSVSVRGYINTVDFAIRSMKPRNAELSLDATCDISTRIGPYFKKGLSFFSFLPASYKILIT